MRALREMRIEEAAEALLQVFKDTEWASRYYLMKATDENALDRRLAKIGEPTVPPLIRALTDKDTGVVKLAAKALGDIGDRRAVEPLIQALKDQEVADTVAWALGQLGDPRAIGPLADLLGNLVLHDIAVRALASIGDERALGPLMQALNNADYRNRAFVRAEVERLRERLGQ